MVSSSFVSLISVCFHCKEAVASQFFSFSQFCVKGVLRSFEKFTGKHLCQSLFFNKVADLVSFLIKFKLRHYKMVKYTQTIRRQEPTNCLSVFCHFAKLGPKGLTYMDCKPVYGAWYIGYFTAQKLTKIIVYIWSRLPENAVSNSFLFTLDLSFLLRTARLQWQKWHKPLR